MYTWATLKAAVKALMTDKTISDDTAVAAIAAYTRAIAARDLFSDEKAFALQWGAYQSARKDLLGYTVTLDTTTLRSRVRELITDATIDDNAAVRAVADFVKSRIELEVNGDLNTHQALNARWLQQRNRLLGYTITLNASALRTAVDKLITVDSTRAGISETGGFIDVTIAQAQADIASLATFINKTIDQGKIDLAGSATQIDNFIRQGVIELQNFIPLYRKNNETTYEVADLEEEGEASIGTLPEGAKLQDAFYVQTDADCKRVPLSIYNWGNRHDLICGAPKMIGGNFLIAFDPDGETFIAFPKVLDGYELSVFWEGSKLEYADGDTVPFDEGCAKAISDYVLSEMLRRPGPTRDLKAAETHFLAYTNQRRSLYREARARRSLSQSEPSPATMSTTSCAIEDTDTAEAED